MTDAQLKMLQRIADESPLFTEYESPADWYLAIELHRAGLIVGKGIVTGKARLTITAVGQKVLDDKP